MALISLSLKPTNLRDSQNVGFQKTELHLEVNIRLPLYILLPLNLPVHFLSLALCFSPSGATQWIHERPCHRAREAAVSQRYAEGRPRLAVGAETSQGRTRYRFTHVQLAVNP